MESKTLSASTVKRLAKDVREIMKNPLTEHGIFYHHDEDDILKADAMIVGPPNTPYYGGYFFFKFTFPEDYPHNPPSVKYYTNDGIVRFNPNLYRSGKVCLSILNTWKGPQWTACQTISSVLLCLCATVLNDKPLLNEPGILETHKDYDTYHQIVTYKKYEVAILQMIDSIEIKTLFPNLHKVMTAHFEEHSPLVLEQLAKDATETRELSTSLYSMTIKTNYSDLKKRFAKKLNKNI